MKTLKKISFSQGLPFKVDTSFLRELGIKAIPRALLADYTTFRLGGPCRILIPCSSADQITATVHALRASKSPFVLMGFGSNILASDEGVDSIVIRYCSETPLIRRDGHTITVDAATQFDALAEYAIKAGLEGMTNFSGIPGTVGGAIAGNAGAYGSQISDSLVQLTILDNNSRIKTIPKDSIRFEYRDSDIKHNGHIILSADFRLLPGNADEMMTRRKEIIHTRETKHGRWQDNPCAGSFFRNIEPTSKAGPRQSAGWFIENAGAHRLDLNGAHSYSKHANIITRDEKAQAKDVYALTLKIMAQVKEKFGIQLVREVRLLGRFERQGNDLGYW